MKQVVYLGDEARFDRALTTLATSDRWEPIIGPDGRSVTMVPSATIPGRYYSVSERGCTCEGFQARGSCRHWHALGLSVASVAMMRAAR
jgi:hypothetical protein